MHIQAIGSVSLYVFIYIYICANMHYTYHIQQIKVYKGWYKYENQKLIEVQRLEGKKTI
jgi:hypothetical protein